MLDYINIHPLSLKILQSVAAAIITYAIAYILIQLLNKKIKDIHWKHRIRKTLYYTANILAIWFVLMIWLENMPSLTTIMSFTGAGLVLTLREEILSISAWLYITFQKLLENTHIYSNRHWVNRFSNNKLENQLTVMSSLT